MKAKTLKVGDPGYTNPYMELEADPLWPLVEKELGDLVKNQELIEPTDRAYIVGYICKQILKTQTRAGKIHRKPPLPPKL